MSQAEQQAGRDHAAVTTDPSTVAAPEQLVRARVSKGLAVADLAARLGMVPRQVLAIERGDWTALPGRSFARSALRSYGRALGIDTTPLLPAIDQAFGETSEYVERPALDQPMPRRGALGFAASGSGNWLAWTVLIVVALVVLAFFYGGGASLLSPGEGSPSAPRSQSAPASSGSPSRSAAGPVGDTTGSAAGGPTVDPALRASGSPVAPAAAPSVSGAASAPALGAPTLATSATVSTGGAAGASASVSLPVASVGGSSSAPVGATPVGSTSVPAVSLAPGQVAGERARAAADSLSAAQSAAARAQAAAPPSTRALSLSFAEPAWIEIRDAGGRVLVTGTQAAGSSAVIEGQLPLSAVVGNAGRVTATWRGAPFDLNPHMRQGVARFNIE